MTPETSWKAVATDIDATLTDPSRLIDLEAIKAIREVEESGIPVMLVSGNILWTVQSLSRYIGTTGPLIAENGAVVMYGDKMETLGEIEPCLEALKYLKKHMDVQELANNRCRLTEIALKEDVDPEEVKLILAKFPVSINATGFAIHIMPEGTDKFIGLKRGCEILGIEPHEVIAIGDSENDIGMIRGCGMGVAVANAGPDLKVSADLVTSKPHGSGVVEALRTTGLIKD
jgi:phosphoglycolate phosphatase (TIGR01487 family)